MPRPSGAERRNSRDVELGLAEEHVGAAVGERDQFAQDDAGGRGRQPAQVLELDLALVAGEVAQHGAQVGQIDQREALRVGVVEDQPETGLLRLVQAEHLAQQQRTEARDGGADRHALADAAERVVLRDGCRGHPVLADRLGAREQLLARLPRRRDAGQVALDVCGEHRHALGRQLLGEALQRAGLAGAGGAGDEAVPVHHAQGNADLGAGHRFAVHERTEVERRGGEGVARDHRLHLLGIERSAATRRSARLGRRCGAAQPADPGDRCGRRSACAALRHRLAAAAPRA